MLHDLQGIQAFVKIAEIGCFTRASHFLHTSQPALTRRIKKLEEQLGATLFERTTRNIKLTAVGREFLPKAKNLIDFYESSILSIKEMYHPSKRRCHPVLSPHRGVLFPPFGHQGL